MSTHKYHFQYRKEKSLSYPISAAVRIFQGTEERVRNSRGRRAISVRGIQVLLYLGVTCPWRPKHFPIELQWENVVPGIASSFAIKV